MDNFKKFLSLKDLKGTFFKARSKLGDERTIYVKDILHRARFVYLTKDFCKSFSSKYSMDASEASLLISMVGKNNTPEQDFKVLSYFPKFSLLIKDIEINRREDTHGVFEDAPFETMWIEIEKDGFITGYGNLLGVFIYEVFPTEFYIMSLYKNINDKNLKNEHMYMAKTQDEVASLFCTDLFKALKTSDIGEETIQKRAYKINHGGNVFINKIVHIRPKKPTKQQKEYFESRKIDWSHSWEVRGHWRKCSTIGRDRQGNYCVSGMTWVRPFVKGNGELIEKIRVIGKKFTQSPSS